MRNSVALVGFHQATMKLYKERRRKSDIWSVNYASTKHHIGPLKTLIELHDLDMLRKHPTFKEHWKWLHQPHGFPIYMMKVDPSIPSSERYPFEDACDLTKNVLRGGDPAKFFTSSFDFLMALAILKGYEDIYLYGFEMETGTEYSYQRPGQSFWIAYAAALGIRVHIPEDSQILKSKVYAYEGSQMISRQALEKLRSDLETQLNQTMGKQNHLGGQITERVKQGQNIEKLQLEYVKFDQTAHMISGGLRVVNILIQQCDLLEPDTTMVSTIDQLKSDDITVD